MDEVIYEQRAAAAFRQLMDLFEDVDPDEADLESTGDVITIGFAQASRLVINTQRPARQIWLAGGKRAWHFSFDEPSGAWLDDKGRGHELFATIRSLVHEAADLTLPDA